MGISFKDICALFSIIGFIGTCYFWLAVIAGV